MKLGKDLHYITHAAQLQSSRSFFLSRSLWGNLLMLSLFLLSFHIPRREGVIA